MIEMPPLAINHHPAGVEERIPTRRPLPPPRNVIVLVTRQNKKSPLSKSRILVPQSAQAGRGEGRRVLP